MRAVILEFPEDILAQLESKWRDVPRAAREVVLAEGYRDGLITAEQLRQALGLDTRMEIDEFLKLHNIPSYTVDDFEHDRATLQELRNEGRF